MEYVVELGNQLQCQFIVNTSGVIIRVAGSQLRLNSRQALGVLLYFMCQCSIMKKRSNVSLFWFINVIQSVNFNEEVYFCILFLETF